MTDDERATFRAPLDVYEREAAVLLEALKSRSEDAAWRFKWVHPDFRGKSVGDVNPSLLDAADARLVVARDHAFDSWNDLAAFTVAIAADGPEVRFEEAVEAVIDGEVDALRSMLRAHPELSRERSSRAHRATLLHYIAANGVEGYRQRTPPTAVEITKMLLDAGADVDAAANMYDSQCTTMSMLVSSAPPATAGLQTRLAETLLDYGAALDGPGPKWQSSLMTALAFGYIDTARALVRRGAPVKTLEAAAGIGLLDDAQRLLPGAAADSRHAALALAAQHGHGGVVSLLLDAGEDPSRYNPEGFHGHSTPLHQAVWSDHLDVVRTLVERGARLDVRDTVYGATPLGWAEYGGRTAIAEYLRSHDAP
jgi:ankyrin repeat protein